MACTKYIGLASGAPKGVTVHPRYLLRDGGVAVDLDNATAAERERAWKVHFPFNKAIALPDAKTALKGLPVLLSMPDDGSAPELRGFMGITGDYLPGVECDSAHALKTGRIGPWKKTLSTLPAGCTFYLYDKNKKTLCGPVTSRGFNDDNNHRYLLFSADEGVCESESWAMLTFHTPSKATPTRHPILLVSRRKDVAKAPVPQAPAPQEPAGGTDAQSIPGKEFCLKLQRMGTTMQNQLFLHQPFQTEDPPAPDAVSALIQHAWMQERLHAGLDAVQRSIDHLRDIQKQIPGDDIAGQSLPLLTWMQGFFTNIAKNLSTAKPAEFRKLFFGAETLFASDITRLYEYFCFYRLAEGINALGFGFQINGRIPHPLGRPAQGSPHLSNIIHFRKGDSTLTLYREPAIGGTLSPYGPGLVCIQKGDLRTPDFVLKISSDDADKPDRYVIVDAKWSHRETSGVLANYSLLIQPPLLKDSLDMVWTFEGKPSTAETYKGISTNLSVGERPLRLCNCIVRPTSLGDDMDFFWREFRKLLPR